MMSKHHIDSKMVSTVPLALTFLSLLQFQVSGASKIEDLSAQSPTDKADVAYCTLKSGAPIGDKLNSLLVGPKGPSLLADVAYIEETAHFNRERIPERVVHAKGAAAYGEFVVTNTRIAKYCKASLFSEPLKTTPVAVRFSQVTGEAGSADTVRDVRGFSVKFRTDAGNWDLVGNNLPVFFVRDPINFVSFIHSQKRHPKTHMKDHDAFWDFITMLPETLHTTTMLFTERGIPDGYRHMHGYGVNTFKLVNGDGEAFYAKFHWVCNQKVRNLDQKTADSVAGLNPDYSLSDLFQAINDRKFPKWTLKAQVMSLAEADRAGFNVFDATKTWPFKDFPLIEIGVMTLMRNPENYFAEVEQLAFSPANMVPGIEASPDKMLVGRMFSYSDAQRYRLGVNNRDLPVNRPVTPVITPTYVDGHHFTSNMSSSMPNYVPSIYYKNLKTQPQFLEHNHRVCGLTGRYSLADDDNYSQVKALVNNVLNESSRKVLVENLAQHLQSVRNDVIIDKVVELYSHVNTDLAMALNKTVHSKRESTVQVMVR